MEKARKKYPRKSKIIVAMVRGQSSNDVPSMHQMESLSLRTLDIVMDRQAGRTERRTPGATVKFFDRAIMEKPTGQASSSNNADDGKHLSELAYQTWKIVKDKEKNDNRWRGRKSADNDVKYFDLTDWRYGWLLPGWLAEERRMPTGRLYKV
ncbi:hypothetical protein CCACVL1_25179 [Corchorus capsularis]|uniref:Uncharacterized protein n=1 Tax=Corchorus capsularis TaxID=210143 RepID=A0A1R3GLP2_COCAP|nr:hypothetical protein CCACVL1_25179 [Corchorus capsularis]